MATSGTYIIIAVSRYVISVALSFSATDLASVPLINGAPVRRKMMNNFGAIDADSLVYQAGFASQRTRHIVCTPDGNVVGDYDRKSLALEHKEEDPILEYDTYVDAAVVGAALSELDDIMVGVVEGAGLTRFRTYLTGGNQWRVPYSTIQKYKGNRDHLARPVHYQQLRDHLVEQWDAYIIEHIEADDAVIMDAYTNRGTVICSIDKDLRQFSGWHYDPKHPENGVFEVSDFDAIHNFYTQLLTGDSVDNIKGLSRRKPRRGIGVATARKILADCGTEREMFEATLAKYHDRYPEDHTYTDWQEVAHTRNAMEMLDENAQLLYLARFDGDKWSVPK